MKNALNLKIGRESDSHDLILQECPKARNIVIEASLKRKKKFFYNSDVSSAHLQELNSQVSYNHDEPQTLFINDFNFHTFFRVEFECKIFT